MTFTDNSIAKNLTQGATEVTISGVKMTQIFLKCIIPTCSYVMNKCQHYMHVYNYGEVLLVSVMWVELHGLAKHYSFFLLRVAMIPHSKVSAVLVIRLKYIRRCLPLLCARLRLCGRERRSCLLKHLLPFRILAELNHLRNGGAYYIEWPKIEPYVH